MNDSQDDFQDRIQRIMNDYKRQEITERYGGQFSEPNPDLSPDVEAQWLNNIDEFEHQFQNAKQIVLRDLIGAPAIRPLADIAPADVEAELDHLLDMLTEHEIFVNFLHDIDDAEAYRFITEELLNEAIDDIRVPGFQQHFIYEEFHPNAAYDAQFWAEEFLEAFFDQDQERLKVATASDGLLDAQGTPLTKDQMTRYLSGLRGRLGITSNVRISVEKCSVTGNDASIELAISWNEELHVSNDTLPMSGSAALRLKRSPHTGWDVIQFKLVIDNG
jgi:hypothetical protein